jgi:hypothetical protein
MAIISIQKIEKHKNDNVRTDGKETPATNVNKNPAEVIAGE